MRDVIGKSPIHIAAAKLNRDIFEKLIRSTGADPMMPDAEGNTFLHIMALGVIKDTEYDFIRQMVIKHGLRLTRNRNGESPLYLVKNTGQNLALRGQPNFKRKIAAFFEERLAEHPTFQDARADPDTHKAILAGDLAAFKQCLTEAGWEQGKLVSKRVMDLLEQRDSVGKTCFFLATEHSMTDILDFLMDAEAFPALNLFCKDTFEGDIPLHMAVRVNNHTLARKLFVIKPEKCLATNFKGHTPIFIATQ